MCQSSLIFVTMSWQGGKENTLILSVALTTLALQQVLIPKHLSLPFQGEERGELRRDPMWKAVIPKDVSVTS